MSQGSLEALQDLGGASVVVKESITQCRELAHLFHLITRHKEGRVGEREKGELCRDREKGCKEKGGGGVEEE